MSKIEWTGKTWNPVIGCRRVSAGCENCYAERTVHRGMAAQHVGLTKKTKKGPVWNGKHRVVEHRLDEPVRRKKPTIYFVNSLSDLFFEPLPNELIAAIFGVMAACPQHTFQVLTKRPERARDWFRWVSESDTGTTPRSVWLGAYAERAGVEPARFWRDCPEWGWPLPNVWLGVSVEDQATADERIPILLDLPAAVRWVSYEPALGPVDFDRVSIGRRSPPTFDRPWLRPMPCEDPHKGGPCGDCDGCRSGQLNWVVVGGESGPGARPFDLAWARSTIAQCKSAGVPCFVKQLGENPTAKMVKGELTATATADHQAVYQGTGKRSDPSEWPEDLRVREMPS